MAGSNGKFRSVPNPPVTLNQLWTDEKTGAVRRVIGFDEWEVKFANVVTGVRTRVQRVTRNGSPNRYRFIERIPEEIPPVHIRRRTDTQEGPAAGLRETLCGQLVDNVVVSCSQADVPIWKSKRREICKECDAISKDPTNRLMETMAEASAA
jgi:hypothetical protein